MTQIAVIAFGVLLLGAAFILARNRSANPRALTEGACAFVAFFFLLAGLSCMIGTVNRPEALPGALAASMALTFFWVMNRRPRP
jgi:hypothetical protein